MTSATTASAPVPSGALPRTLCPKAVILAEVDHVRLGDILLDTIDGPLVVDEVVRRRYLPLAEFAEHRTVCGDPRTCERHTTERRRIIENSASMLRIARDADAFARLSGHSSRVRSHNPVRRGCYVLNDGWLAQCSCGWPGEEPRVCGGKQSARREWLEHKASQITSSSCDGHLGYFHVAAAEEDRELPPLPWSFAQNGAAIARLDELDYQHALQVATAWAEALGQPLEHGGREHHDSLHVAVPRRGENRALVAIGGYFKREGGA